MQNLKKQDFFFFFLMDFSQKQRPYLSVRVNTERIIFSFYQQHLTRYLKHSNITFTFIFTSSHKALLLPLFPSVKFKAAK